MRHRSVHGGRHELGQNFLTHPATITKIVDLVARTDGPILEIGAGSGALTVPLARLSRPLRAIDIDEHRVQQLRHRLPDVDVEHADALREPFDRPVIVGNLPFHLTTPILRRLLNAPAWQHAVVLTQWEVARKRAGVGGSTMMTAQAAPWFEFTLHGRVPAHRFSPRPSVDGGILGIRRRQPPLLDPRDRRAYERFVREIFTGRGRGIGGILKSRGLRLPASIPRHALPRDLTTVQWIELWHTMP